MLPLPHTKEYGCTPPLADALHTIEAVPGTPEQLTVRAEAALAKVRTHSARMLASVIEGIDRVNIIVLSIGNVTFNISAAEWLLGRLYTRRSPK